MSGNRYNDCKPKFGLSRPTFCFVHKIKLLVHYAVVILQLELTWKCNSATQYAYNKSNYLLRWIIALNAKPSRHELVKSVTRTPGYLAVERLAHLNNASRADTLGSWPTTISDIWRKKKESLLLGVTTKMIHWIILY